MTILVRIVSCLLPLLAMTASPVLAQQKGLPRSSDVVISCQAPLGQHRYYMTYTCPIGGQKFSALTLGTLSVFGRYFDLQPASYMDFPAPLPVCPANGFVVFKRQFTPAELDVLGRIIRTKEYRQQLRVNTAYYLFGYIADRAKLERVSPWYVYLQATWEASRCGRPRLYKRYVAITQDRLTTALKTRRPQDRRYWMLKLLQANLYRRTSQFDKAKAILDALPMNGHHVKKPYRALVRDLHELVEQRDTRPRVMGRRK